MDSWFQSIYDRQKPRFLCLELKYISFGGFKHEDDTDRKYNEKV